MMNAPVIESLFPEFCNQGGDNGNIMYLRACLPDAEVIETSYSDEPAFVTRDVTMLYLGNMTEDEQEKVAAKLMPYRARLLELVDRGCVVLATGNAAELFGTKIVTPDGRQIPTWGIFDFTTRQDFSRRIAEVYLGTTAASGHDELEIVGYKIQFTQMEGDNSNEPFCKNSVGFGLKFGDDYEGWCRHNLIATWLCGPLLPLNPLFTEYLMGLMGVSAPAAYRDAAMAAYTKRLEEFKQPGIRMPI